MLLHAMALFGRESDADRQRAQRIGAWASARSPYAIFSAMFGLLAVLDAITGILGILLGAAAIIAGGLGLRDIARKPNLLGKRLCITGITLGCIGVTIGVLVWVFLV